MIGCQRHECLGCSDRLVWPELGGKFVKDGGGTAGLLDRHVTRGHSLRDRLMAGHGRGLPDASGAGASVLCVVTVKPGCCAQPDVIGPGLRFSGGKACIDQAAGTLLDRVEGAESLTGLFSGEELPASGIGGDLFEGRVDRGECSTDRRQLQGE